jgi:hypothetical protein
LRFVNLKIIFIIFILFGGGLVAYSATNFLFTAKSSSFDPPSTVSFLAFQSSSSRTHHSPALRPDCNHLTLDSRQSTIPKFSGLPAVLVYACGKAGEPAFSTVKSSNGNAPLVTPTFTGPSGWTLSVGIKQSSGECSLGDGLVSLRSGIPVVLVSGTNYVYCMSSTDASSFPKFSISWSQD